MSNKSEILKARCEPAVKEAFEQRAKDQGCKPGELLRRLILAELDKPEPAKVSITPPVDQIKERRFSVSLPIFLLNAAGERAKSKGMSTSRWVASLVQSNITGIPVMSEKETGRLEELKQAAFGYWSKRQPDCQALELCFLRIGQGES
ncbi:hypothetical protein [Pseudomonas sp. JG-B]|uniref:hypothetical protein n=1 Tax=Pseudomonas sp. JG-B TaxID=2603214 RepID=UPI002114DA2C|nr:hypothetical protein [Pseudomonas sp. JG-B]